MTNILVRGRHYTNQFTDNRQYGTDTIQSELNTLFKIIYVYEQCSVETLCYNNKMRITSMV